MTKEMFFIEEVTVNEAGVYEDQNFSLKYHLINNGDNTYGIEILKVDNTTTHSEKSIINITTVKENALNLINKLAKNKVTPLTLGYIGEDFFNN
ncbi:MAG: hypothetical protein J6Y29_06175 [Clostridiales bacterium]|nr:hypothetical protein [Clostridiales bacterium]